MGGGRSRLEEANAGAPASFAACASVNHGPGGRRWPVTGYEDFVERLEAALEHEDGREDFLGYLEGLTREQRAELLAEADRRELELECN
jgi:hypothetical protein